MRDDLLLSEFPIKIIARVEVDFFSVCPLANAFSRLPNVNLSPTGDDMDCSYRSELHVISFLLGIHVLVFNAECFQFTVLYHKLLLSHKNTLTVSRT